jgi:hypothetical protein
VVELGLREAHHCDFQHDDLLRGALHLADGSPNGLKDPHRTRETKLLSPPSETFAIRIYRIGDLGGHLQEKGLAHFPREALGQLFGVPALARQLGERAQRGDGIRVDEGAKESVEFWLGFGDGASGEQLIKSAQRIAS